MGAPAASIGTPYDGIDAESLDGGLDAEGTVRQQRGTLAGRETASPGGLVPGADHSPRALQAPPVSVRGARRDEADAAGETGVPDVVGEEGTVGGTDTSLAPVAPVAAGGARAERARRKAPARPRRAPDRPKRKARRPGFEKPCTRTAPTPRVQHELLLGAARTDNDALGLRPDERIAMKTLARSTRARFQLHCSFFTDLDLDTTDAQQLSCRTDSFVTAAYRARPARFPVPRRVRE